MLAIGLNEDLFDAGVVLLEDGAIRFAANEERYTRRKNEGGFPAQALAGLFAYTGVRPEDIDAVFIAGHTTPPYPVRAVSRLHDLLFDIKRSKGDTLRKRLIDWAIFALPLSRESRAVGEVLLHDPRLERTARRMLPAGMARASIQHVEHHSAHAAAAWHTAGFEGGLCITADGMGDGLSITVSRCSPDAGIERLWHAPASASFGTFFEFLTEAMGFVPCRDEGKLTGLAANGDATRVPIENPFVYKDGQLHYSGAHGIAAVREFRAHLAAGVAPADLAAWAQEILEDGMLEIVRDWLGRTGARRLMAAGGIFANVSLNHRLHALPEVEQIFICPNMGDGGLGLGAAILGLKHRSVPLRDVFLGEDYPETALRAALDAQQVEYEVPESINDSVAQRLAENRIVARFSGRMEWGPRALGNRSILARPSDTAVVERLNGLLKRSDFMPFAPAMLDEDAPRYLKNCAGAEHAAQFMTVCFECTDQLRAECPAIVHVDGTARAQIVTRDGNPDFHDLLTRYKAMTGSSVVLNTSFNIHEEPIVRTPDEAVRAFLNAGLDYLALGDILATLPLADAR